MVGEYFEHDKDTRKNFWQATFIMLGNFAKAGIAAAKGELELQAEQLATQK